MELIKEALHLPLSSLNLSLSLQWDNEERRHNLNPIKRLANLYRIGRGPNLIINTRSLFYNEFVVAYNPY